MTRTRLSLCCALAASAAAATLAFAQDADDARPGPATRPSADAVMEELLLRRESGPATRPDDEAIDPAGDPVEFEPARVGMPAAEVDLDPAVLGVAPGGDAPDLRREGEFIVNRRGRLTRAPDGGAVLFQFVGDNPDSPEPPMVMQKCRMLQSMEELVAKRGDDAVFIVSGQVFTYRGANYLLPTMMKVAVERGNLE